MQLYKSNLRLPIEIYAHNKGKNNIEISSLKAILSNTIFRDLNKLSNNYAISTEKNLNKNHLEIFTIMDKDRCDYKIFNSYKSKEMFKKHWLYKLITPIYNIEYLEEVLIKAGYKDLRKNKKEYIKLFPINRSILNIEEIQQFHNNLLKAGDISNLHIFVEKCLSLAYSFNK